MRLERAETVLVEGQRRQVFPAATAEVGTTSGALWSTAIGHLSYTADSRPVVPETVFDLASLTKVLSTATLAARLVDRGAVTLDERVTDRLPAWLGADRADVTIQDLLEHCSGLPSHRRYFETLAGRAAYEAAICAEALAYPPRTQAIYSDPGFVLLGFVLEDAGGQSLDRQFDAWRDAGVGGAEIGFRPPLAWRERAAPTEDDPWRGRVLIGEVHDENAVALDGVAGHAGLFGTAAAVGACARWWLRALRGEAPDETVADDKDVRSLSPETARRFARRSIVPGSSRALGWDTMLPTSSCGTRLSPESIGHTGYTGTSLWLDPSRDLYVVLLTNRVHPTRHREGIQDVRRTFHDAVILDLAV
jgi:serine-type D-Ala-D-Ala carboxypeptidase